MVRFAAALSQHPVTAHAVGEAAGQVLERLGDEPDLALLFVTRPHAGALEDASAAVRTILRPRVLLGCAAESIAGTGQEVEQEPAVSLWAAELPAVVPLELRVLRTDEGLGLAGWPDELPFEPEALVLLADPYSFPADGFFAWLADTHPKLPVVGGMASAALGPGGNRLAVDSRVHTQGAVGALLGPGVDVVPVVSQGCRPIGRPLVVTRADSLIVHELAGRPAYQRLLEVVEALSPEEVGVINAGGLHLGQVIDEHKPEFRRGDFLIRNVLGGDQESGAIKVGDVIEVGTTVQFHLRDAEAADEDLRSLLSGQEAEGALLFTCNGRGSRLFGVAHHDAGLAADLLGGPPLAGFFCQGEFGPVGGRNFLHGFTASLALFR
ncbi:MAG TPA: FIST N-terminal domain-containing protein [Acidimicrobiales bacterium]|nr:FIST N-terminal domain-containing protein [Acidimicrobiales bacterium]